MKFPFTFGPILIFRLFLPGLVFAIGLSPIMHPLLGSFLSSGDLYIVFPLEVLFCGWFVVLLDGPIYAVYEGRKWWPSVLWKTLVKREEARLDRLINATDRIDKKKDYNRWIEAWVERSNFPIDDDGEQKVRYPTRLGNLIYEYENYPDRKYGIDGPFFWYRIWVSLDKDLRSELDNIQALPDSVLYMSFCLHCSGILSAVYAVLIAVSRIELMYIQNPEHLIIVSTLCFSFGFIVYRLSLPAHRRFGEAFKAVFDQYRDKLLLQELSDQIDRLESNPEDGLHDLKTKGKKVWRYLRWHRIRPLGELENYTLGEWKRVIEEKKQQKKSHT